MADGLTPRIARHNASITMRENGVLDLGSGLPLGPVADKNGQWLRKWAAETPDAVFLSERSGEGIREITFGEALQKVEAIAASLLERGLNADTPVLILSSNSINHGLMTLAGQYVGIPTATVAEQYSLIPAANERLLYVADLVKPGLIYAEDAGAYGAALDLEPLHAIPAVATNTEGAPRTVSSLDEMLKGNAGDDVAAAFDAVTPDTIAKYLFTSGSTDNPKGVPTTQRMICVNQAQMLAVYPFFGDRKPRLVDWLPWNHVFGGNHNFNLALSQGGSMHVDEGKPVEHLFHKTLANLRDRDLTLSFNVPVAYGMLLKAFRDDKKLRDHFFTDLDLLFYSGASLPEDVWQALENHAREVTGTLPLMSTSWGMTETAPACLAAHEPAARSGVIGVPMPQVGVKLLPVDEEDRYEIRVKGPNVMDGYFKAPDKNAESFDEEGYLITGDAVKFAVPGNVNGGLLFDGRISEDFKLLTGTWVRAATLRLGAMQEFAGLAADIVITGHDRRELGMLMFADAKAIESLDATADDGAGALTGEALAEAVKARLDSLASSATGSSTRIARALVVSEPPSIEGHEITAKGNLNNRKVLTRRAALVERLYSDDDPAVIRL